MDFGQAWGGFEGGGVLGAGAVRELQGGGAVAEGAASDSYAAAFSALVADASDPACSSEAAASWGSRFTLAAQVAGFAPLSHSPVGSGPLHPLRAVGSSEWFPAAGSPADARFQRADALSGVGGARGSGLHGEQWRTALFDAASEASNGATGPRAAAAGAAHRPVGWAPRAGGEAAAEALRAWPSIQR